MRRRNAAAWVVVGLGLVSGGAAVRQAMGAGPEPAAAAVRLGGCFCGAVRYEITGPLLHQGVCHCQGCKRASGAGAVPWLTVTAADFHLTQGALAEARSDKYPKDTCDGHGGVRGFCPRCGTPLTFVGDDRADREIDITAGTLDDLTTFTPTEESFAEQRLAWIPPLR